MGVRFVNWPLDRFPESSRQKLGALCDLLYVWGLLFVFMWAGNRLYEWADREFGYLYRIEEEAEDDEM